MLHDWLVRDPPPKKKKKIHVFETWQVLFVQYKETEVCSFIIGPY